VARSSEESLKIVFLRDIFGIVIPLSLVIMSVPARTQLVERYTKVGCEGEASTPVLFSMHVIEILPDNGKQGRNKW